jgi:MFS family permease
VEIPDRPEVPRRVTTLRVLRANPAFSSLVTAIGISSLGDPMTQVATLVSIFAATRDPKAVALAFIVQALATIVISAVLGGVADKFPRRPLVVTLELTRAVILVATPMLLGLWWGLIIPVLFVLALINAVVQPARQAAIPGLVPAGQVGKAYAIVAATSMLAGAVGFAVAGAILASFKSTTILFIADAATFALAAVIVLGIPSLGGGAATVPVSGAARRTWSITAARPYLVIGTLAAFLIPMSLPALLAVAYRLSASNGGQTYSSLEVVLSVGIFVGSVVVGRFGAIGSMRTVGAGLLVSGIFSVGIAFSHSVILVAPLLFLASLGNPVYTVANQTALMEVADPSNRGSVMATRFGLAQTASIVGMAAGGLISSVGETGPFVTYGVLGVGLVLLAMYALAAGRSTINPLHGAAYEEAQVKAAANHAQADHVPAVPEEAPGPVSAR